MIDIPDEKTVESLRRLLEAVRYEEISTTLIQQESVALRWIAGVVERCDEFCDTCGKDRRYHAEHRPRHPFRVNGRRSRRSPTIE